MHAQDDKFELSPGNQSVKHVGQILHIQHGYCSAHRVLI